MARIRSILENDLYKFAMSYYYMVNYPQASGTFEFYDRNNTQFSREFIDLIKEKLKNLDKLFLQQAEFIWCVENIKYIPQYFWEWLQSFRFNSRRIAVGQDSEGHLKIKVHDLMYRVTFYEIPILAIISDVYHQYLGDGPQTYQELQDKMMDGMIEKTKIAEKHNLFFADFGLRRSFNSLSEDIVCEFMYKHCNTFVGTSNVYLAKCLNIKPIGTMAHEIFMFEAAINSPKCANHEVMKNWVNTFHGNLGTVLTDTFTLKVFLADFSMKYAKLYDGVRHDSGSPYEFGDQIIAKYKSYGIDPMSKTIIFSDGLNFPEAAKIKEYFAGRIKTSFGIGTNLTCDIPGVKPMNIVMKLKNCKISPDSQNFNCVKLSDVITKAIGEPEEIKNYKFQLRLHE